MRNMDSKVWYILQQNIMCMLWDKTLHY